MLKTENPRPQSESLLAHYESSPWLAAEREIAEPAPGASETELQLNERVLNIVSVGDPQLL